MNNFVLIIAIMVAGSGLAFMWIVLPFFFIRQMFHELRNAQQIGLERWQIWTIHALIAAGYIIMNITFAWLTLRDW